MNKVLASIGIGSATVETVFPSRTVTPGESVDATIQIEGGSVEQGIRRIDLALKTGYSSEDGYDEATVDLPRLFGEFTVGPGGTDTRTVTLDVPRGTPVTVDRVEVWIETRLVVERAVDAKDTDALDVQPTPRMQALFDAAEELGLSFRRSACRADPRGHYTDGRRFVQRFEFRPQRGPLVRRLDEVGFVLNPRPHQLDVYVDIDRHGRPPGELTSPGELPVRFVVREADVETVRSRLRSILEEHAHPRRDAETGW